MDDKLLPHITDDNVDNIAKRDNYLNMELGLPRGDDDHITHATVKRRKLDEKGTQVGTENNNLLLDTRVYEVEFIDGTMEALAANVIAENLLSQVDEEGHRQMLIDEIIDHRADNTALLPKDGYIVSNNTKRRKMTTKGWQLCVQWKDGSTDWV